MAASLASVPELQKNASRGLGSGVESLEFRVQGLGLKVSAYTSPKLARKSYQGPAETTVLSKRNPIRFHVCQKIPKTLNPEPKTLTLGPKP